METLPPHGEFVELVARLALAFAENARQVPPVTLVEQIVAGAVATVPGVDAAAVQQLTPGGLLAAPYIEGDQTARTVMEIQNELREGPSLSSVADAKQIVIADLTLDIRWPLFAERAAETGARSMSCTPLVVDRQQLGVLVMLGRSARDDTDQFAADAQVFGSHVAIALLGEERLTHMHSALATRDLIGQAKGVLMERFNLTPDAAFAVLVQTTQRTNTKLRTVCEELSSTRVLKGSGRAASTDGPSQSGR